MDRGVSLIVDALNQLYRDDAEQVIENIGHSRALLNPKFHRQVLFAAM